MEKMKRILALLLVFAMLMPNLSTIALAADTEDSSVISTEPAVTAEETEASAEETETTPQVTEPSEEETQPPVQETEPPATEETQAATETAEETVEPSAAEETEESVKDTVTVTSRQEALAEQTAATVSGQTTATVIPDFGEDFDNDKVFAVYVEDQFLDNLPVVLGTSGKDRLPSDAAKNVYDVLKARIEAVAAGESHSTVVEINVEEESKQLSWTKEELGVDVLVNGNSLTQEASAAIKAAYQAEMDRIMNALLVDCPYDLYWFDKTAGMDVGCSVVSDGQVVNVTSLKVSMTVASGYQGSDQYTTTTELSRVQTAAANAKEVAEKHKNEGDYEKLTAFKEEICSLVSYNTEAADENYNGSYGDPWQLIYVFDDDEETDVVCEGYSKAFQYLCELSEFDGDVESFQVSGYADGPHMWNIVSIEGRNYLVDVTNSEEGSFGENGELFMAGAEGSIEDGYTFYIENDSLTYFYSYEAEKEDGTKVTIQPSIDLHGTEEDSILNLSFLGYQNYQEISDGQWDLIERDNLEELQYIVDDVELQDLGDRYNLDLTISGATLKLSGYTVLHDSSIVLENGARLVVEDELYLEENTTVTFGAGTFLQISGTEDERNGTLYVRRGSSIITEESSHILVPDGAIYADFYAMEEQVPGIAPEKLTAQTWVMDQESLGDSLNDMALEEGQEPLYHRYEIIADDSFAIEEKLVEFPWHIAFELRNWGDWDDPVIVTIPEGSTLKISGCYMGVYEGTQLLVEGTMENAGYLRTHYNSSIKIVDNGVLKIDDATVDNQGVIYAVKEDSIQGRETGTWQGDEPIYGSTEMEPFLSLYWLRNRGNGWYEDNQEKPTQEIGLPPSLRFYMIAYLNEWNEDALTWEQTPVHASKLVVDENLVLEPFRSITDGDSQVEDGENADCFFRLSSAEGAQNLETKIAYSNTGLEVPVHLGRYPGGFYSADPTSAENVDSLWLNEVCIGPEAREFYFWFDASRYHEAGWSLRSVTLRDPSKATATKVEGKDNLWKITIAEDVATNIYAEHEFRLDLDYEIVKNEDSRKGYADVRCNAGDFGRPNASFVINGKRYNASWSYQDGKGLFCYEGERQNEYPVPASIPGVSYDLKTNTLTLNGAKLESLHIDHHWYNEEDGEEGWHLPDSRFNIELVGENTISATNDHALMLTGDVHLTIKGNGSLKLSTVGGQGNTCQSTIAANESEIAIEDNAKVTVSISGEGYNWDDGKRGTMSPLRGFGNDRWLRLRGNAVLTTVIPENVCSNGYFDENDNFVEGGGFDGIEFPFIEVNDNATLNTQTLQVWDEGRGNAYGAYYQNGGTVNITGIPYYNKDQVSEDTNVTGHYHFSGLEANYGKIEINGGSLNIDITATEAQMTKSIYYHGLQSRGRHIALNGGEINFTANIHGTGVKVGEDNWDGGTNAWADLNGATLNMIGTNIYRKIVDVAPNGSMNFNGGIINAKPADIEIRGSATWNGTQANLEDSGIRIHGNAMLQDGHISIMDGFFQVVDEGNLTKRDTHVELENSYVGVSGRMRLESGAFTQSMSNDGDFVTAFTIAENGQVELCGDAYLEIKGTGKVDGICNNGTFILNGGTLVADVDETIADTAAIFGTGKNRFENGFAYLDGYHGLIQFNRDDHSELYVGGDTLLEATAQDVAIATYAPTVFAGGSVNAYAQCAADPENGIYPCAVWVENNEDGTNASLTISGGNHCFEAYDTNKSGQSRGLVAVNAPVDFTGGYVNLDAGKAVYNVTGKGEAATVHVPVIIRYANGEVAELEYSENETEGLYTVVGNIGFLTSRNCGENVTWKLESGVLTISGTGAMDDYHMPIRDPESWRTAPWYAAAESITKVVVEEGVTYIGDWAFGRLPNVTEIHYPSTVSRIDMTSNYDCPSLTKFVVDQNNAVYSVANDGQVLIENGSLVRAAVKTITAYTAGDGITTIGMGAFDSSALETLDLNKVQVIQNYAFADCYNLKDVVIPEGIATIEMTVFQNSGLQSITIPASVTKIRNYAFDGCADLADVYYSGSETQWNAIVIGSGNNALTSIPVTFLDETQAQHGEPYLSYRLLTFGDRGYYEDMGAEKTEMTIPVGFYPSLVVYCNYWNPEAKTWERFAVDPEQLYAVDAAGNRVEDLEIGPFRYYEGIGIEDGEPNAYNFFEMAFRSGWGSDRYLCLNVGQNKVAKLPVKLARGNVGFYSADPTKMSQEQRNAAWLNLYRINPNVSGHSVYFALTEYDGDFSAAPIITSNRLSAEDLAKVKVEVVDPLHPSVYKITLPDDVAAKVHDYRGIPLKVTYEYGDVKETVEFIFGSVSFAGQCYTFGINGTYYEYYPGLEGYFSWDDNNQKRLCYKELPGGMSYDEATDTLTMKNSAIESLQVFWNWHNEETGESGYATKDSDLTLKLIGENKIINPGSNAALAVGNGLTLTITGDENSSLLISATNEYATAGESCQNAVNVYDNGSLIIAGDTSVTTSISGNENMTGGWLMNLWGNGNNTLVVKDNATLTTTLPAGARDDGDAYVNGYRGIDWFGEIRVQDNATLNTSTLGLGEYYDENRNYHGKGSYVQTGGTVTIEALGCRNEEGRHNYDGFMIHGDTHAQISGGKLTVKANAANVAADRPGEDNTTYAWFNGIQVNGHLDISGENTLIEVIAPDDGAGLSLNNTEVSLRDGATLKFTGNGKDNYALDVSWNSNFQLNGGNVDITDAKVRVMDGAKLEIHDGTLSVIADKYSHQTYLETWQNSEFILHNGDVVVNNGFERDDSLGHHNSAVSIGGNLELNGGTMTVVGSDALSVHNDANLYQNGSVLKINGCVTTLTGGRDSGIYLNGGITEAVLGKSGTEDDDTDVGQDGNDIDMGEGSDGGNISLDGEPGMIINTWSSALNIYDGGYMEVNDGHHTFRVDGAPAEGIWLSALDVNGTVNFNGGTVLLDAGEGGQAIFNRTYDSDTNVHMNNDRGAVSLEDGTPLQMRFHGANEENGEQYYVLGDDETFASRAKIIRTAAGNYSSWRIEKSGDKTTLIISGNENMHDYYMPQGEAEADWEKTPWFDYNDQITHVVVEDGINSVGDWVFARMTALKHVELPGSVNHISTSAFYGCTSLETFAMPGNRHYKLDENTCTDTNENGYPVGTVIIEGGWKVLKAAPSVTEYEVPYYIAEIGNGAFQDCENLAKVTFEEYNGQRYLKNIGNNAFENTGLTEISIPNSVGAIGRNAFADCTDATAITLPDSVNTIRPYAFSGCSNVTTVTYTGTEEAWNKISIGTGNSVLDKVVWTPGAPDGGDDYLSFRWLSYGENGWEENGHPAETTMQIPAGFTFYGVFFYNHFNGTKWEMTPVIPEAGAGVTIEKIDENMLEEFDWTIPQDETHGDYFIRMIVDKNAWDGGEVNYGVLTYQSTELDIRIQRNSYGFYSAATASNETWLNDYEMNPLKKNNEFYFIFEGSGGWKMDDATFRIWNDNGVPDTSIRSYACGNGVFRILLDPIFLQDAWRYGYDIKLHVSFEAYGKDAYGEDSRSYEEEEFQLHLMDLGNPDAVLEINDQSYLYFAEENGWMTHGDPANDWRPGVAFLPAGVSYTCDLDTGAQTLTLNNANLNNLSLAYRIYDGEANFTGQTYLPNGELTLNLIGSSRIESGHREALNIKGDLKVTVTGTGTLYVHSDNDPENRNEYGERYAFDNLVLDNHATLNIAGGTVIAEISGEGYWNEGNPAMPAALRGRDGSHLEVTGGSLTTVVPEHARDNGPGEVDFEEYYSTHAIAEFESITVSGGTLSTTSLYVNSGEAYKQTGGTTNITGLGHLSWQWDEYGNRHQNYHYNALQVQQDATFEISGGQLNLTVTPKDWENGSGSYYNGLSIAGGTAEISGDAKIHVTGAYDGCAISVGHDYDDNGQPCAYGNLTMTGGALTVNNTVPEGIMNGVEVHKDCTADISGGNLDLTSAVGIAGIGNNGTLTIGGTAKVIVTESVWSNGLLTVKDNADIQVIHPKNVDMYAWDIVPGSRFDFRSGTITAENAAFMIGGEMEIGENAVLTMTDSDFNADGEITLKGSLTMTQNDLVDNLYLGEASDEWGNTWDEYKHQSRLYVTGGLNLDGGKLELNNAVINVEGRGVVNQNGTTVSVTNEAVSAADRKSSGNEGNDWIASVNVNEEAVLNINGGSFTVNNTHVDGGLNLRGTMNMRNGTLTVAAPGGIAIAARGEIHVSGGEMNLSGDIGYEQAWEEGFEQGKLTVTGGTINIDAVNTGIDLYNDMVVTGGEIDIDISGYTKTFTDEDGTSVTMQGGCGIMGYNDAEKLNISINGGTLRIDAPVEAPAECNAVSVFGILGGRNATVRVNGGDVSIKARTALYAESQEDAKHIVINNRLHVLSLETGNTLNISSGVVEVVRDGETYIWYVDTCEEDETWTTPYNNVMMADYANNLKIVNKTAGRNAFWDMENGVLTISTPSGTIGSMVSSADWNLVADKVTSLVLSANVQQPEELSQSLFPNLQSVKTPCNTPAASFTGVNVELIHEMVDGKCQNCEYSEVPADDFHLTLDNDNMTLGSILSLNFWVYKNQMREGVEYTAKLIRNYADGRTSEPIYIPKSEWVDMGSYYQVVYDKFAAKEMTDSVSIEILMPNGARASNVWTDSIQEYAMYMINTYSSTAKYRELCITLVDMLNYGAAAQVQFKYSTDNLANARLTDEQQSLATSSYDLVDHWAHTGVGYSSNLELNDRITLRLWFKNVTEDMYAIATFTNHYGNEVSTRVDFDEFSLLNANTKSYSVPVSALVIADGCQVVTCKLYDGNGVEVGSCTESVQSYLKYMIESNQDTYGLYDVTMKFVTSAYNYFH